MCPESRHFIFCVLILEVPGQMGDGRGLIMTAALYRYAELALLKHLSSPGDVDI